MISLAICTYNRSEQLKATLHSLASQEAVDKLSELLIIDNNSTDATQEVARLSSTTFPLRLISEITQGLANARNRAVCEYRGDILLFTDDDMRFEPGWLAAYMEAFASFPDAQFFGGRILPDWTGARPKWLKDERLPSIAGVLGRYDNGKSTRYYAAGDPVPFGGSFAIRRSLIGRVARFQPELGRIGTSLGRGEETEFFLRAIKTGAVGVYVGKALCWHKVDSRRLSVPALFRYGIESGRAHKVIAQSSREGAIHRVPLHIGRGLAQLLKGRGDRFRQCVINAGIEVGLR